VNSKTKKIIVKEARKFVAKKFPETKGNRASCLYLAVGVIAAAAKRGYRLVPQAGTCYWPRVTPETDDGVENNAFGYKWSPHEFRSQISLACGALPEMHVWAGDPVTQEIVDLSTRDFPAQCKKILDIEWKAPAPPDFYWGPAGELPNLCVYEPNEEATILAVDLFGEVAKGRSLTIGKGTRRR
jgi:hypothetical protein